MLLIDPPDGVVDVANKTKAQRQAELRDMVKEGEMEQVNETDASVEDVKDAAGDETVAKDGATDTAGDVEKTETVAKETKSIVNRKYAGKYKTDQDGLAKFIREQCATDAEGKAVDFDFAKYFELCSKNGIKDEHIDPYRPVLTEKINGIAGRARMTLRNRLAGIVRKNGKLVGLDGEEHEVHVAALPPRSAAQEAATDKIVEQSKERAAETEQAAA